MQQNQNQPDETSQYIFHSYEEYLEFQQNHEIIKLLAKEFRAIRNTLMQQILKDQLKKMKNPFSLAPLRKLYNKITKIKQENDQKYIEVHNNTVIIPCSIVCGKRKQKAPTHHNPWETQVKHFVKKEISQIGLHKKFDRVELNRRVPSGYQGYSALMTVVNKTTRERFKTSTPYVAKERLFEYVTKMIDDALAKDSTQEYEIIFIDIRGYTANYLQNRVRGGQNIITFNRKFEIFSPQSRSNCLYHCIVWFFQKLINKTITQKNMKMMANQIKTKLSNDKDYSNYEDVQAICDYYNCVINVYSPTFTLQKTFKQINKKLQSRKKHELNGQVINIQFKNQHCFALYPRQVQLTEKQFLDKQNQQQSLKELCEQSKPIKPEFSKKYCECHTKQSEMNKCPEGKYLKERNECKLVTWDLETFEQYDREITTKDITKHYRQFENIKFDGYNKCIADVLTYKQYKEIKEIKYTRDGQSFTLIPMKYKNGLILPYYQFMNELKCKVQRIQVPFRCGVYIESNYYDFNGLDCIDQFIDYLDNYEGDNLMLYAHNGGRFDVNIILKKLTGKMQILQDKYNEINSCIINLSVINKGAVNIHFRDSYRMLIGSLDQLCKDFKVRNAKISDHKFKFYELDSVNVFKEFEEEIGEYLKYDCLSLYEILDNYREEVWKDISIDIMDCLTAASLSKKHFFQNYYWKMYHSKFGSQQIYDLPKGLDLAIRKGYMGGRCDIYHQGIFDGKFYYYDFTSLYPYVSTFELPYGKPEYIEGNEIQIRNGQYIQDGKAFYGFLQCKVTTNDNDLQLHGYKHGGKLLFSKHKETEMMLFSEEVQYGLTLGNKYEIIYGIKFDKGFILKDFMKEGFQKKALAKKEGNSVLETTHKLIINCGYGFWGYRWMDRRGCISGNQETLNSLIQQEKLYNWNQLNDTDYILDCITDQEGVKGKNIAIASAITSYARMQLFKLMKAVTEMTNPETGMKHKLYYSDTDAIISDCDLTKHQDLQLQFMWDITQKQSNYQDIWDGTGSDLGSLKNELTAKMQKNQKKEIENLIKEDKIEQDLLIVMAENDDEISYIKQQFKQKIIDLEQQHAQQIEEEYKKDNGDICFNQITTLMPKGYGCKKNQIKISKMKGFVDMTYEQLQEIANGGVVQQQQDQFISGKQAHINEDKMHIQMRTLKKNVQLIYNKGIVRQSDKKVIPLTFIKGVQVESPEYYEYVIEIPDDQTSYIDDGESKYSEDLMSDFSSEDEDDYLQ